MSKKKSLSSGVVLNIIATSLLKCIGIITAPIITKLLDPADYGVISIYSTWCGIVGIILGLQTYGSLTNARLKHENDKDYYNYCWNSISIVLVVHVAAFVLLFPSAGALSNLLGLRVFLIYAIILESLFQNCISFMSAYFLIENRAVNNFILSAIITICSFGLSYYLAVYSNLFTDELYMAFIVGNLIVQVIVGTICLVWFGTRGFCLFKKDYTRYCLMLSVPLIFHGLSSVVLGQSDRIMLDKMEGAAEAGIYSFTYNFSMIVSSIRAAINGIWTPFFFTYLHEKNTEELEKRMKNFDILYISLIAGFLLLYPEVFRWLANERYWSHMGLIPVLMFGLFWMHLYSYPANYEVYSEKTNMLAIGSVGAAGVNIVLNYFFIKRWHATGAAYATLLSYIALYIFHLIVARNYIGKYPVRLRDDFFRLLFTLPLFFIVSVMHDWVWTRWVLAFLIGILIVFRTIKNKEII